MTKIIVECKPDEAFVRALGFSRKQVLHQPNKGEVLNYLRKNHGSIGIVDEDPGAAVPGYLRQFEIISSGNHQIDLLHHKNDKNLVVIIKPKLEDWIFYHSKALNIDPTAFYLPGNPDSLHKVINYHIPKFIRLLRAMSDANCPAFQFLQKRINKINN